MEEKIKKIAELNDLCRRAMGVAGRVFVTEGIAALPPEEQAAICEKVERYNAFKDGNDPYCERDLGAFDHGNDKVIWKIDYYDKSLTAASPDPSDPARTTRILIILLAWEY